MTSTNNKASHIEFKHANDKFNIEVAKELGIDLSNNSFTTIKIIYAYELGLKGKL